MISFHHKKLARNEGTKKIMIEIKSQPIKPRCEVAVPGSKSYTHRILIASALSDGICRIENALISEDTQLTAEALKQLGIQIEQASGNQLFVYGGGGVIQSQRDRIYLGNSGTSMRMVKSLSGFGLLKVSKFLLG